MSREIMVINGPNLGQLGARETQFYGDFTHAELVDFITIQSVKLGLIVEVRQSDDEATLIKWIHEVAERGVPLILNPAAFTHYSVALRDACSMLRAPLIEVHLSNPLSREEFRHTSLISGVATGTIAGFKADSYRLALIAISSLIE